MTRFIVDNYRGIFLLRHPPDYGFQRPCLCLCGGPKLKTHNGSDVQVNVRLWRI